MINKRGSRRNLMIAELKTLLNTRWTFIVLGAYALFSYGVFFSEGFRQIWVQVLDGNLLTTMFNLYMPTFLFIVVLLSAAPIFAGDKKNGMEELGDTCFYGKTVRRKAKVEAMVLYTFLVTIAGFFITAMMSLVSKSPLNLANRAFEATTSDVVMSNGLFYLFCFAMILLGLLVVTSVVVLSSSKSDDVIVPLASGILIYGVELALYLKPVAKILWDINLFRMLRPYTMLLISLYFDSTAKAIVASVIIFSLLSVGLFALTINNRSRVKTERVLSSQST
ncbi:hypothetical protein [Coprothermobacter platensis]|uniref:hypothetical protein n=1 Tax=Coprothermobacter platensis TaxID=108819 RepID=UPI000375B70C|nr:hypothetical protein [Coprothermobacter platensis]